MKVSSMLLAATTMSSPRSATSLSTSAAATKMNAAAAATAIAGGTSSCHTRPRLSTTQRDTLTPFQIQVYEAIMSISPGQVTTYKHIADAIHCKSSQAIGQALKRNPYNGSTPDVPCHRVIKSDGTVGGLSGSYSNAGKKLARLQAEGVLFHETTNGQFKVDPQCIQKHLF